MRSTAVKNLGEIGLRVDDLDAMREFYASVVGLAVWTELEDPPAVFLEIADGHRGHTRFLALFDRSGEEGYRGPDPARTTVDHFAFEIDRESYEAERDRLNAEGVDVREREFPKWHFRSFFFDDPEGNTVEFVAYDESVDGDVIARAPDDAERGR